jgi:hypothetical protein
VLLACLPLVLKHLNFLIQHDLAVVLVDRILSEQANLLAALNDRMCRAKRLYSNERL